MVGGSPSEGAWPAYLSFCSGGGAHFYRDPPSPLPSPGLARILAVGGSELASCGRPGVICKGSHLLLAPVTPSCCLPAAGRACHVQVPGQSQTRAQALLGDAAVGRRQRSASVHLCSPNKKNPLRSEPVCPQPGCSPSQWAALPASRSSARLLRPRRLCVILMRGQAPSRVSAVV